MMSRKPSAGSVLLAILALAAAAYCVARVLTPSSARSVSVPAASTSLADDDPIHSLWSSVSREGFCDDPDLQGAANCPLSKPERAQLRRVTEYMVANAVRAWKHSILESQVRNFPYARHLDGFHTTLYRTASKWHSSVTQEIPYLLDRELLGLAEHFDASPYDRSYFDKKTAELVEAYWPIAALEEPNWMGGPLRLAWVTSQTGPARLATYRTRGCDSADEHLACAAESYAYMLGLVRLRFDRWIDPSMYDLALERAVPLVVAVDDPRWDRAPTIRNRPDEDTGIEVFRMSIRKHITR